MPLMEVSRQPSDGYRFTDRRDRLGSAVAVVLIHAAILYALFAFLGVEVPGRIDAEQYLKSFDVDAAPARREKPAPDAQEAAPEGESSAENRKARASPVVAPPVEVPQPVRIEITAAPVPREGNDGNSGASPVVGPGMAAGGSGDGSGTGVSGSGQGAGGAGDGLGGGVGRKARLVSGRITTRDYPRSASVERAGGTVTAWYTVGIDGRARNCTIARSSGNADLDAITCRLIEKRFRYEPARGRDGRPVAVETGWEQKYWLEGRGGGF